MSRGPVRDGRSGLVFAGVALIAICYGFARFTYGLFSPEFAAEFDLSATLSGVIGSGSYLGYCLAIVISSRLTPRWGPRRVAVLAGVIATAGMAVVALAPSAAALAVGVLVAGSSTGIASPPLAAAVARWIREDSRDTAQTVVNAGTGVGVLVSGPVALLLLDHWRWAWGLFAATAALATMWIRVAIPAGVIDADQSGDERRHLPRGGGALVLASFAMGAGSVAVWTLGRELLDRQEGGDPLAPLVWTTIGAAGIGGALAGPAVRRLGMPVAWAGLMVGMAAGTAGIAIGAAVPGIVLATGALFGASYIALTGVLLVWATRLFPDRASFGVGLSFFTIAAGQAIGSPLAGVGADLFGTSAVFYACAGITLIGAALRTRPTGKGPSASGPS